MNTPNNSPTWNYDPSYKPEKVFKNNSNDKITPRGKKKIIVSAVSIWAVWFVFGRTDAVEFIIVEIEKQMMNIQEWNILSLF